MIFGKFFGAIRAQINKVANLFWEADPVAQMRYEYDSRRRAAQGGPAGLEQYRGAGRAGHAPGQGRREPGPEARSGDQGLPQGRRSRRPRRKFALELQKAKAELAANEQQLAMHETGLQQQPEEDPARQQEADRRQGEDPEVRRRAEDERGRGGDRQARPDLEPRRHHRFRRDRGRHPAEDRREPRQGARRGRPVERGHRRDQGRGADGEVDGRRGAQGVRGRARHARRPRRRRSRPRSRTSAPPRRRPSSASNPSKQTEKA